MRRILDVFIHFLWVAVLIGGPIFPFVLAYHMAAEWYESRREARL